MRSPIIAQAPGRVVKAAQVWREVCHGLGIKAWRMRTSSVAGSSRLNQSPPRSPNGAACPSPKPRRASRRRLAASAGCARRPPRSAGELGETSGGGAGATGWVGARGGKGRSRAAVPPAPPQPRWRPGRRPGRGLPAPDRAGPPRVWAPPGPPWQGLRPAGSVGRVGRPQAWAPAGAGWQGVGGRGRVGLREKWLCFSYTPDGWLHS